MDYIAFERKDETLQAFVVAASFGSIASLAIFYALFTYRHRKDYWQHGVRLPSRPNQPCWYLVAVSVGCRPWAGHEGDVFIRLIGSRNESHTFLVNGEAYSRLHEAETHLYVYSSVRPLGEIDYVIVVCGATTHKKRWFLSSVYVACISECEDQGKHWYFPYHQWIEVFLDPIRVTLCGVDVEHDVNKRLILGWLSRGITDFHLWASLAFPLKYTQFHRYQRFLLCGTHLTVLPAVIIFLNVTVPNLGFFVLGLFSSTVTAAPLYIFEWIFRQTKRYPKVILEDPDWYTGLKSPEVPYDVFKFYNVMPEDLFCPRENADPSERWQVLSAYPFILEQDEMFWKWVSDASSYPIFYPASFHEQQPSTIRKSRQLIENIKPIVASSLKNRLPPTPPPKYNVFEATPSDSTTEEASGFTTSNPSSISSQTNVSRTIYQPYEKRLTRKIKFTPPDSSFKEEAVESSEAPTVSWQRSLTEIEDGYKVVPDILWKVSSNFSLETVSSDDLDYDDVEVIKTIPAEKLRSHKVANQKWFQPTSNVPSTAVKQTKAPLVENKPLKSSIRKKQSNTEIEAWVETQSSLIDLQKTNSQPSGTSDTNIDQSLSQNRYSNESDFPEIKTLYRYQPSESDTYFSVRPKQSKAEEIFYSSPTQDQTQVENKPKKPVKQNQPLSAARPYSPVKKNQPLTAAGPYSPTGQSPASSEDESYVPDGPNQQSSEYESYSPYGLNRQPYEYGADSSVKSNQRSTENKTYSENKPNQQSTKDKSSLPSRPSPTPYISDLSIEQIEPYQPQHHQHQIEEPKFDQPSNLSMVSNQSPLVENQIPRFEFFHPGTSTSNVENKWIVDDQDQDQSPADYQPSKVDFERWFKQNPLKTRYEAPWMKEHESKSKVQLWMQDQRPSYENMSPAPQIAIQGASGSAYNAAGSVEAQLKAGSQSQYLETQSAYYSNEIESTDKKLSKITDSEFGYPNGRYQLDETRVYGQPLGAEFQPPRIEIYPGHSASYMGEWNEGKQQDLSTMDQSYLLSTFSNKTNRKPASTLEGEGSNLSEDISQHIYRRVVGNVQPMTLPLDVKRLTEEEGQLVSMIYTDLNMTDKAWLKPGIPQDIFNRKANKKTMEGIEPVSQSSTNNEDYRGEKSNMNERQSEPIRRDKVFSMLVFKDYTKKLADAFTQMVQHCDLSRCLSRLFVLFADTDEACCLFCDACLEISILPEGRQALCTLFAGARKSCAWAELISSIAQRLKFQGDNIKRIRRKYGLDVEGETCDQIREENFLNLTKLKKKDAELSHFLHYELNRMFVWSTKLDMLRFSEKDCQSRYDYDIDTTRLSRYFRSMILDPDGCVLFIELMLQITIGKCGAETVSKVLRCVASKDGGVERFVEFHRVVAFSGLSGRRILIRLYNAIKRQKPDGPQVLACVANNLDKVPAGQELLADLQVDSRKGHMIAYRFKTYIHENLDPLIQDTAKYLRLVVTSLSVVTDYILTISNHAKGVLEKSECKHLCKTVDVATDCEAMKKANPVSLKPKPCTSLSTCKVCKRQFPRSELSSDSNCTLFDLFPFRFPNISARPPSSSSSDSESTVSQNESVEKYEKEKSEKEENKTKSLNEFYLHSKDNQVFCMKLNPRLNCSKCFKNNQKRKQHKTTEIQIDQLIDEDTDRVCYECLSKLQKESTKANTDSVKLVNGTDSFSQCDICSIARKLSQIDSSNEFIDFVIDSEEAENKKLHFMPGKSEASPASDKKISKKSFSKHCSTAFKQKQKELFRKQSFSQLTPFPSAGSLHQTRPRIPSFYDLSSKTANQYTNNKVSLSKLSNFQSDFIENQVGTSQLKGCQMRNVSRNINWSQSKQDSGKEASLEALEASSEAQTEVINFARSFYPSAGGNLSIVYSADDDERKKSKSSDKKRKRKHKKSKEIDIGTDASDISKKSGKKRKRKDKKAKEADIGIDASDISKKSGKKRKRKDKKSKEIDIGSDASEKSKKSDKKRKRKDKKSKEIDIGSDASEKSKKSDKKRKRKDKKSKKPRVYANPEILSLTKKELEENPPLDTQKTSGTKLDSDEGSYERYEAKVSNEYQAKNANLKSSDVVKKKKKISKKDYAYEKTKEVSKKYSLKGAGPSHRKSKKDYGPSKPYSKQDDGPIYRKSKKDYGPSKPYSDQDDGPVYRKSKKDYGPSKPYSEQDDGPIYRKSKKDYGPSKPYSDQDDGPIYRKSKKDYGPSKPYSEQDAGRSYRKSKKDYGPSKPYSDQDDGPIYRKSKKDYGPSKPYSEQDDGPIYRKSKKDYGPSKPYSDQDDGPIYRKSKKDYGPSKPYSEQDDGPIYRKSKKDYGLSKPYSDQDDGPIYRKSKKDYGPSKPYSKQDDGPIYRKSKKDYGPSKPYSKQDDGPIYRKSKKDYGPSQPYSKQDDGPIYRKSKKDYGPSKPYSEQDDGPIYQKAKKDYGPSKPYSDQDDGPIYRKSKKDYGPSKPYSDQDDGPIYRKSKKDYGPSKPYSEQDDGPVYRKSKKDYGPSKPYSEQDDGPVYRKSKKDYGPSKPYSKQDDGPIYRKSKKDYGSSKEQDDGPIYRKSKKDYGPSKPYSDQDDGPIYRKSKKDYGPSKPYSDQDDGPIYRKSKKDYGPSKPYSVQDSGSSKPYSKQDTSPNYRKSKKDYGPSKPYSVQDSGSSKPYSEQDASPNYRKSKKDYGPSKPYSVQDSGSSKPYSEQDDGPIYRKSKKDYGPSKPYSEQDAGRSYGKSKKNYGPSKPYSVQDSGSSKPYSEQDAGRSYRKSKKDYGPSKPYSEQDAGRSYGKSKKNYGLSKPYSVQDSGSSKPYSEQDAGRSYRKSKKDYGPSKPYSDQDDGPIYRKSKKDYGPSKPYSEQDAGRSYRKSKKDYGPSKPYSEKDSGSSYSSSVQGAGRSRQYGYKKSSSKRENDKKYYQKNSNWNQSNYGRDDQNERFSSLHNEGLFSVPGNRRNIKTTFKNTYENAVGSQNLKIDSKAKQDYLYKTLYHSNMEAVREGDDDQSFITADYQTGFNAQHRQSANVTENLQNFCSLCENPVSESDEKLEACLQKKIIQSRDYISFPFLSRLLDTVDGIVNGFCTNECCDNSRISRQLRRNEEPKYSYLYPLKAACSYEKAKKDFNKRKFKVKSKRGDGECCNTQYIEVDSDDESAVYSPFQQTFLQLLGLEPKKTKGPSAPLPTNIISCDPHPMSPCSAKESLLLLQGINCKTTKVDGEQLPDIYLSLAWWKIHEICIDLVQQSFDSFITFQILIASTRVNAIENHEKTCSICLPGCKSKYRAESLLNHSGNVRCCGGKVLGTRFSQVLPVIWKAEIQAIGGTDKLINKKQRFERSLVDTVVKSVQFFLLAPDVLWSPNASRASISQSNVSGHGIPQGCVALLEKKEKEKTIANVNSLAHFRRMLRSMKFFHDQIFKVKKFDRNIDQRDSHLCSKIELNETTFLRSLRSCSVFGSSYKTLPDGCYILKRTIIDALVDYIKNKMCGTIQDCGTETCYPWQLPACDQIITAKFLSEIMDLLKLRHGEKNAHKGTLDDVLEGEIESYLGEIVSKAITQTSIQKVVTQASIVKQYLTNLELNSRMCFAKIMEFANNVRPSAENLKSTVKNSLKAVGEGKGANEYKDYSQRKSSLPVYGDSVTVDDLLIEFERLRRHVRYNLILCNAEVLSIKSLIDVEAMKLFNIAPTADRRKQTESYEPWTESDITVNRKKTERKYPNNYPHMSCRKPSDFSILNEASNESDDTGVDSRNEVDNFLSAASSLSSSLDDFKDTFEYPDENSNMDVILEKASTTMGDEDTDDNSDKYDDEDDILDENMPDDANEDDIEITFKKSLFSESPSVVRSLSSGTHRSGTDKHNIKNSPDYVNIQSEISNNQMFETVDELVSTKNDMKRCFSAGKSNLFKSILIRKDDNFKSTKSTKDYQNKLLQLLNDETTYKQVKKDETKSIERRLNSFFKTDVVESKKGISTSPRRKSPDLNIAPFPSCRAAELTDESEVVVLSNQSPLKIQSYQTTSDASSYTTIESSSSSVEEEMRKPEIRFKENENTDFHDENPLQDQISSQMNEADWSEINSGSSKQSSQISESFNCSFASSDKTFVPDSGSACFSSNLNTLSKHDDVVITIENLRNENNLCPPPSAGNEQSQGTYYYKETPTYEDYGHFVDSHEDFTSNTTKYSFKLSEGKEMLKEIFSSVPESTIEETIVEPEELLRIPLRPPPPLPSHQKDEVSTYYYNLLSLLSLQSGQIFPHSTSIVIQCLLWLLAIIATVLACYQVFTTDFHDRALIGAFFIALLSFILVIEPLKCLIIAWILFLTRRIPAFYNSPLYIKSHPAIIRRSSRLRPHVYGINRREFGFTHPVTATGFEEELFHKYSANHPRQDCRRHQRRIFPAPTQSRVSFNLENAVPFGEVDLAIDNRDV